MQRVVWTPRARSDLDAIWLFVATESPGSADRLIDNLIQRSHGLADHPRMGPARPDIAPDARMLVEGDYLILYRLQADGVAIVRVVHGARRLGELFDSKI